MYIGLEEVVDFIAGGTTPEKLIAFRPSDATLRRIRYLFDRRNDGILTAEESTELDTYLFVETLMSHAKARARLNITERHADGTIQDNGHGIPCWFAVLASSLLPLSISVARASHQSSQAGLRCRACG